MFKSAVSGEEAGAGQEQEQYQDPEQQYELTPQLCCIPVQEQHLEQEQEYGQEQEQEQEQEQKDGQEQGGRARSEVGAGVNTIPFRPLSAP